MAPQYPEVGRNRCGLLEGIDRMGSICVFDLKSVEVPDEEVRKKVPYYLESSVLVCPSHCCRTLSSGTQVGS